MANAAYTSMFERPCESTPNCDGSYTILLVVQSQNTRKQVVKCDKCNAQVDRYVPA